MGAYTSKSWCEAHYNMVMNCTVDTSTIPWTTGDVKYGEFEPNGDIGGIGIIYSFSSVTFLALACSLIYLILQLLSKQWTGLHTVAQRRKDSFNPRGEPNIKGVRIIAWFEVLEAVIWSCSDQQIFTACAYAVTLRFYEGCKISAYHYNILGNLMMMGCATHLASVSVISQYFKHTFVSIIRIVVVTGLYIITALLLCNQNASPNLTFPTDVPADSRNTTLVLPAACFQEETGATQKTIENTFGSSGQFFVGTIGKSSPENHIPGWNFFILMIIWYCLSVVAEVIRFFYKRHGPKTTIVPDPLQRSLFQKLVHPMFWLYQVSGVVLCIVFVGFSFTYVQRMRTWMAGSKWMKENPNGTNDESQATSFGQLLPLFLMLLTVFSVAQVIGDKRHEAKHQKKLSAGNVDFTESPANLSVSDSHQARPESEKDGITTVTNAIQTSPPISP